MKTYTEQLQEATRMAERREDLVAAYVGALRREDAETVARVRAVAEMDPTLARSLTTTLHQYKDASDALAEYERQAGKQRPN